MFIFKLSLDECRTLGLFACCFLRDCARALLNDVGVADHGLWQREHNHPEHERCLHSCRLFSMIYIHILVLTPCTGRLLGQHASKQRKDQ